MSTPRRNSAPPPPLSSDRVRAPSPAPGEPKNNNSPGITVGLFGPGGAGKSCLTVRYVSGTFNEKYDPTIEDSYNREDTIDGTAYSLRIYDTAGQENFSALAQQAMNNVMGAMIVVSIDHRNARSNAARFLALLRRSADSRESGEAPRIMLAINKIDLLPDGLLRAIQTRRSTVNNPEELFAAYAYEPDTKNAASVLCELMSWAEEHRLDYELVSAKADRGVSGAFHRLAKMSREAKLASDRATAKEVSSASCACVLQ